tara:strand:- start:3864 stop:4199 length:336 start_codon:yes stop_codon:yes gene_type:complete
MKEKEIKKQIKTLGNSIEYYCSQNESLSEDILIGMPESRDELKSTLELTALHSLYIRIIGYATLKSMSDILLAEKIARRLGVDLIQNDLKEGREVPTDIVDSMLDEINRTK